MTSPSQPKAMVVRLQVGKFDTTIDAGATRDTAVHDADYTELNSEKGTSNSIIDEAIRPSRALS